jgi:hypothetical protein
MGWVPVHGVVIYIYRFVAHALGRESHVEKSIMKITGVIYSDKEGDGSGTT